MKFYSFHPGMKLTCKQKVFHPRASFIPGWDSVLVTCKHTLNGLNDKTQRTVIGNEYLILVLYQFHSLKARDLFWKDCAWKDWPYWGTSFFQGSRHWCQNFLIWRHRQFFFFYFGVFLLPSVVTGTSFMSVSLLVRELWQFSIIRDWPEIRKSEIPPSEFLPISGDWAKSGIPNLTQIRMSLMKCYWML